MPEYDADSRMSPTPLTHADAELIGDGRLRVVLDQEDLGFGATPLAISPSSAVRLRYALSHLIV